MLGFRRLFRRPSVRWTVRLFAWTAPLFVAILAAAIVATLTVDLGPSVRARAEQEGSKQIKRPVHIGKLGVHLFSGRILVENVVIEGLQPTDRPFLTARRIAIVVPWWTLLRGADRELLFETVDMTDWRMLVETFPDGRHNVPRFTTDEPSGPKRFRTTLQSLRAWQGQFTYDDHQVPWRVVAPNLELTIANLPTYNGRASFRDGTVAIQDYLPMKADLSCRFTIDGGKVHLQRIDLRTDGAESVIDGVVDFGHWPEQLYNVRSHVNFPRMRQIFFARERFSVDGHGDFTGTFHLFKGGRELKGTFASPLARVNEYRFPEVRGSLLWVPDLFEVSNATSGFYGGTTRFTFTIAPGARPTGKVARFDASYAHVDLAALTDFLQTKGVRLAGRASGRNLLVWPLGQFSAHSGEGQISVEAPAGETVMSRSRLPQVAAAAAPSGPQAGRSRPPRLSGYLPVGGEVAYVFDREWIDLAEGHLATPRTSIDFGGRTAYGERSRIPFSVTSADWQESDQVLAAILTAFGSPTGPVPIGGWGEFEGILVGAFSDPRIEGTFRGEAVRAFDVVWGRSRARVVIEDGYVDVAEGRVDRDDSQIQAEGRFSLGYPRRDGGEEIDARLRLVRWDVATLRHAFQIDDYPIDGRLSGDYHVYSRYERPIGFGSLTIEEGVAYGEPFELATAAVRFEGAGIRLDALEITKGNGEITGAAYVGWDGSYSFSADGRRLAMEELRTIAYPRAPLSGLMTFTAGGSGTFAAPRYDVKVRVSDLFISDEGVGQLSAELAIRGKQLTVGLEAASPRLAVSGSGRIALVPGADAELTFRFTDTSLDPYVRAFEPRLSPFTTAVASGAVRVVGELRDVDRLLVDGTIEQLDLRLFDYTLRNANPIRVALDQHTVRIDEMRLVGEDTQLDVGGTIGLHDQRIALHTIGTANLGVLQGFFRDVRSSGRATLQADIQGPLKTPLFAGNATIAGGRIRHFSLPHSIEEINGRINFDARAIRLVDVVGRVGGGTVRFGGRIGVEGYLPGELNVTAVGEEMRLRYPEGVQSIVDADLTLHGNFKAPTLAGTVTVNNAVLSRRLETGTLLDLTKRSSAAFEASPAVPAAFPLRFDVRILAPSTLRVENNLAHLVFSADLTLRGTYDRPLLIGRAEVERGEVLFEGKRYSVTHGTIDLNNPTKIEPFFDVEAETRVRVPGQTYRVTLTVRGTLQRLQPEFNSDPPLATVDVLSLLLGGAPPGQDAELRALQAPRLTEQLFTQRATQFLASPISSEVGKVVEQSFGVDTFQLTPSLVDPYQQSSRINPTARVTIGKRISDRVYLTFSRSLSSSTRDQIILLEYDQSDRLSWIVSQNEDRTYALDVRVRHVF